MGGIRFDEAVGPSEYEKVLIGKVGQTTVIVLGLKPNARVKEVWPAVKGLMDTLYEYEQAVVVDITHASVRPVTVVEVV